MARLVPHARMLRLRTAVWMRNQGPVLAGFAILLMLLLHTRIEHRMKHAQTHSEQRVDRM